MTALDLIKGGVTFGYVAGGKLHVGWGGAKTDAIRAAGLAEVARRIPLLAGAMPPPRPDAPRWGGCDVCLDPLPAHHGGMCWLCVAARRKALADAATKDAREKGELFAT